MPNRRNILAAAVLGSAFAVAGYVALRGVPGDSSPAYRMHRTGGFDRLLLGPGEPDRPEASPAGGEPRLVMRTAELFDVMGTHTQLTVVSHADEPDRAERALKAAADALRDVEAKMSSRRGGSDVSRLNAAAPGQAVALSADTLAVLLAAHTLAGQTQGAFDVTCRPVIELWKQAAADGRLPTKQQLVAARAASGWADIELRDGGAVKRRRTAGVDLGGIAKGFAIDRAVEAMVAAGCAGGLVNVGGDVRCFGVRPGRKGWSVAVENPFHPGSGRIAYLLVNDAAVCTSGDYRRYAVIEGRRCSHIVDPRTALPADKSSSVTVVAPTATAADAWATALSVLGPAGLGLLQEHERAEAMLVIPESPQPGP